MSTGSKAQSYYLSYHCQKHALRLTLPPPTPLPKHSIPFTDSGVCDCSYCLRRKIVWFLAPAGSVEVIRGGGYVTYYPAGSKMLMHTFCGTCGTTICGSSESKRISVNLRTIRDADFDPWSLPLTRYAGSDPLYPPPTIPGGAEAYLARRQEHYGYPIRTYAGGCHCKAVTFGTIHKPLEEVELVECACSICLGNGDIWVYPARHDDFFDPSIPDQPWNPDPSLVTRYTFGKGDNEHVFCKTCGCQLFEAREVRDDPSFEGWKGDRNAQGAGSFGLNIALFNEVEKHLLDSEKRDFKGYVKEDGRKMKPAYEIKA